jgi:hypothetical protein
MSEYLLPLNADPKTWETDDLSLWMQLAQYSPALASEEITERVQAELERRNAAV